MVLYVGNWSYILMILCLIDRLMIEIRVTVPPSRPELATHLFSYLEDSSKFRASWLPLESLSWPERFSWVILSDILFLLSMLLGFADRWPIGRGHGHSSIAGTEGTDDGSVRMKGPRGWESPPLRAFLHGPPFLYEHAIGTTEHSTEETGNEVRARFIPQFWEFM